MYNTWYILNIVLIIVIHIWVDHRVKKRRKRVRKESTATRRCWEQRKKGENQLPLDLLPVNNGMMVAVDDEKEGAVNRNAKIIIPIIQLLFNILFFTICMTGSRTSHAQ